MRYVVMINGKMYKVVSSNVRVAIKKAIGKHFRSNELRKRNFVLDITWWKEKESI